MVSRRYIALCDVLGFTNLVRKLDLQTLVASYESMLQCASNTCRTDVRAVDGNLDPPKVSEFTVNLGHAIFSDTLLVWSECLDEDGRVGFDGGLFDFDGRHFFNTVAVLFGVALGNGFPLRVGIGFGKCVIEPEKSLFVGEAIVNAYEAERCQDWIGAACHPSCLTAPRANNLRMHGLDGRFVGPLVPYPIPMKTGIACPQLEWTIDWPFWRGVGCISKKLLTAETAKYEGTPYSERWRRALSYYIDRNSIWNEDDEPVPPKA